jgi:hypothetical protein
MALYSNDSAYLEEEPDAREEYQQRCTGVGYQRDI